MTAQGKTIIDMEFTAQSSVPSVREDSERIGMNAEETEEIANKGTEIAAKAKEILLHAARESGDPELSAPDLEFSVLWTMYEDPESDWQALFATNLDPSTRYMVERINGEDKITKIYDGPMPEVVDEAPKE